jgi:ankyrin repeat protein
MTRVRSIVLCLAAVLVPVACRADAGEDFLAAVRKGDAARVKALLAQGADVNAKSPYGATGLFFAADRGNMEIMKILLDHGADVKVKDTFYGATPVTWAVEKGHVEIVTLLLSKGAPGAENALMLGVSRANAELVKAALEHKSEIKPEALSMALATATKENHADIAELLKNAGAVLPVKPNFQIDPEVLKIYAGTYASDNFELKFKVVDGKLTGGPIGQKAEAWDALDSTRFQHPEEVGVKLAFTVENGKVVSVTVTGFGDKPMVFKRTEAK